MHADLFFRSRDQSKDIQPHLRFNQFYTERDRIQHHIQQHQRMYTQHTVPYKDKEVTHKFRANPSNMIHSIPQSSYIPERQRINDSIQRQNIHPKMIEYEDRCKSYNVLFRKEDPNKWVGGKRFDLTTKFDSSTSTPSSSSLHPSLYVPNPYIPKQRFKQNLRHYSRTANDTTSSTSTLADRKRWNNTITRGD
jgi:hypothetical protein